MAKITIVHLEGDVIQWYNWLKYDHGALTWNQFKNALLNRFGPTEYENIDDQLTKIWLTSTIQEYQTRFEKLLYLARDWTDQQLLGTFIEGLKPEIKWEVKARQPCTIVAISFARIHKSGSTKMHGSQDHSETHDIQTSYSQPKLTREELRDLLAKDLCWHCDKMWSRDHRCRKGRLLLIEPLEDMEEEVQEHEEEVTDVEQQPVDITMHALANYANPQMMKVGGLLKQQLITVFIYTGSTNNFMNNKVAIRMALPIKDCSKFDVKVTDG
ncbi:hypothetical protein BHE74_00011016 [Ensete ventricosum]|nr:hypothetical protein BHE74_00011016 [Ensete ventricosum]